MQISLDPGAGRLLLRAYEPGRIRINDDWCEQPLLLTPAQRLEHQLPEHFSALTAAHVDQLCALDAEVILIGTGPQAQRLPMPLLHAAARHGRALDVMDTHAACRTFVVLASEGRRVLAALFP